jgi:hypothetical protein
MLGMRTTNHSVRSLVGVVAVILASGVAGCGASETTAGGEANSAADATHPLLGNSAPPFAIDSANNKGKVSLAALNGKVVIVDF